MTEPKTAAMFGSKPGYGRVLLVEDEPALRGEIRHTLEGAGFDVLEADNGEKAITMANEGENPLLLDVVITDIDKGLGVDALNYFKAQYPHVPLIAMTGLLEQQRGAPTDIRIAILGAGKGGSALLDVLNHLPTAQIVGITDQNLDAPGLKLASSLHIPVVNDPVSLISRVDLDLIIDVTGNPQIEGLIAEQKHPRVEVLGGAASKLLWLLIQREREMQTQLLRSEKLAGMIRDGVKDFLIKPLANDRLINAVSSAVEQRELNRL